MLSSLRLLVHASMEQSAGALEPTLHWDAVSSSRQLSSPCQRMGWHQRHVLISLTTAGIHELIVCSTAALL